MSEAPLCLSFNAPVRDPIFKYLWDKSKFPFRNIILKAFFSKFVSVYFSVLLSFAK